LGLLPKFIDDAAGPPAQAVGNTLASLWDLSIGNHVSLWIKKQEVRQQQNLQDYIKKIEVKTQEIPEEYLTEPQLHIVGPVIEASKFYIDSEQLRQMFANLIASSIDIRKTDKTHPSFVEIIKQLSPLDASVLSNFKRNNQIPIVELRFVKANMEYSIFQSHIMNFHDKERYNLHVSSLSNLKRVGLLDIDYSSIIPNQHLYDYINEHPALKTANLRLVEIQKSNPEYIRVEVKKGICETTPICDDFISICL
jgi:hypothetical protein